MGVVGGNPWKGGAKSLQDQGSYGQGSEAGARRNPGLAGTSLFSPETSKLFT